LMRLLLVLNGSIIITYVKRIVLVVVGVFR